MLYFIGEENVKGLGEQQTGQDAAIKCYAADTRDRVRVRFTDVRQIKHGIIIGNNQDIWDDKYRQ